MIDLVNSGLMHAVDGLYKVLPQEKPPQEKFTRSKVISHRGEFDNYSVLENTFPAFDSLIDLGVWGLECDIQWTKDNHPVISHDPHLKRLFKSNALIKDLTLLELKNHFPQVPDLEELVHRYGGQLHLMLELKSDSIGLSNPRKDVLKSILNELEPLAQFHFLSLDPDLLMQVDFTPSESLLPVAETNVRQMSRQAAKNNWAGLSGHFLLINNKFSNFHKCEGQKIGTGFVGSKACLYREINRNVDWIFSNHAGKIQSIVSKELKDYKKRIEEAKSSPVA